MKLIHKQLIINPVLTYLSGGKTKGITRTVGPKGSEMTYHVDPQDYDDFLKGNRNVTLPDVIVKAADPKNYRSSYDPNGFMDFMNTVTLGAGNRFSVSQNLRLAKDTYDAISGNKSWEDVVNSAVLGNNGIFDNPYANMALDIVVPTVGGKYRSIANATAEGAEKVTGYLNRNMGYWGDNLLSRTYGTMARRWGLPTTSKIPETYRALGTVPDVTADGKISLYPTARSNARAAQLGEEVPGGHANFTTDRKVTGHGSKAWQGDDVWIVKGENLINENTKGAFKSVEPSDMFTEGMPVENRSFNPKDLTVVTGNPETISWANEHGVNVMTDSKLQELYKKSLADESDMFARDNFSAYEKYQRQLMAKRGRPTKGDYKKLEELTGLPTGTASKNVEEETMSALKKQQEAGNAETSLTYPNNRAIGSINKAQRYNAEGDYGNVYYDPATDIEYLYKKWKVDPIGTVDKYGEQLKSYLDKWGKSSVNSHAYGGSLDITLPNEMDAYPPEVINNQYARGGHIYRIPKHRKVALTIKTTNDNILTREVDNSGYSRWFRNGKYITPSVLETYKFYDKNIGGYRQLKNGIDIRRHDIKGINSSTPVYTPTINNIESNSSKFIKRNIDISPKQQYKPNGKYITLKTKGNMNLVDIPTNMLDSIAINTGRSNTNIKTNLGLVGKESTFGGHSHFLSNPWSKNEIINPHILTNNHSYFTTPLGDYICSLYKYIPGYLDKDAAARERKAKEDLKHHNGIPNSNKIPHYSFNIMADAFKRYTVSPSNYNRGQGNYIPMVNAIGNEVWNEPHIQNWWNTEGKYYYNKGRSQGINYTYADGGSLDTTLNKVTQGIEGGRTTKYPMFTGTVAVGTGYGMTKHKNGGMVKKYLYGGPGYFLDGVTAKDLDEGTKKVARGFNWLMGKVGDAFNTVVTAGASSDFGQTSPFTLMDRKTIAKGREQVRQKAKKAVEENAVYVSPSSHIAAWTQGSWDPKVGAEVLASDPRLQALGIIGDLATFKYAPKAVRAVPKIVDRGLAAAGNKGAKGRVVAREVSKAVDKGVLPLLPVFPGLVGWGLKQTFKGYHASNEPIFQPNFFFNGWALQTHNAPFGIYFAEGTGPLSGFLTKRPYVHLVEVDLDRPMVLVGEVKGTSKNSMRNLIERDSQQQGADGIIFLDIADNQMQHLTVLKTLNPDVPIRLNIADDVAGAFRYDN